MVFTTFFFRLDYVSFFYCTLSDIVLPISVSPPFNFPLLCLSIAYAYNLSFLILQLHHFVLSLLFSKYFFLTTIPDEGLSLKRRIIKIFLLIYIFRTWIINFLDYCNDSIRIPHKFWKNFPNYPIMFDN